MIKEAITALAVCFIITMLLLSWAESARAESCLEAATNEAQAYTVTYKPAGRLQHCRKMECFLRRTRQTSTLELVYYELPEHDRRVGVMWGCLGTQGAYRSTVKRRRTLSKCVAVGGVDPDKNNPETISALEAFAQGMTLGSFNSRDQVAMNDDLDLHWLLVNEQSCIHKKWCARTYTKKRRENRCNADDGTRAHYQRLYFGPLYYSQLSFVANNEWARR